MVLGNIPYWGYIGIMENKTETTSLGLYRKPKIAPKRSNWLKRGCKKLKTSAQKPKRQIRPGSPQVQRGSKILTLNQNGLQKVKIERQKWLQKAQVGCKRIKIGDSLLPKP